MDQQQLDSFEKTLLELKEELRELSDINNEAGETVTLDQAKVGRLSRMDAMQAQQIAKETARRRLIQLQKIDAALRRLDAGEYGYCLVCGEDIEIGRLQFDPASTRCVGCVDA